MLSRTRFGSEVVAARFDEAEGVWRVRTKSGEELEADVLISGTGQLNRPHVPKIDGLDGFRGEQFHSARWRHDVDLRGRRVAVVGNGASAIQIVPHVARDAEKLTVFQRTANWMIPRNDRAYTDGEKRFFARWPFLHWLYRSLIYWQLEARFFAFRPGSWLGRRMERAATDFMRSQITSPSLREALTPDYPIGCKRILISDDYYPALERPNVEVVTSRIERVDPDAIVTGDGRRHPCDVIVLATGFETTSFLAPMEIEGLGGRSLNEAWRDGAEAYLGIHVADFPNLFVLYGPNTNLGHNSIIFMIECQVEHVMRCLEETKRRGARWMNVRRDAQSRFNAKVQHDLQSTAWNSGCSSWYKTESGKITNNWSGFTLEYWWRTRRVDAGAYAFHA